jgi:hypothetical protein
LAGELRREIDRAAQLEAVRGSAGPKEAEPVRKTGRAPEGFYRMGTVGGWRETLTDEQVEAIMSVATPLLVELGYVSTANDLWQPR